MNKTQNYQLSQWDGEDRILMEDFNADNARVEAALSALAAAADRLNGRFYTGSFSGTGYENGNRSCIFPRKPLFVMFSGGTESLLALPPAEWTFVQIHNAGGTAMTTCSLNGNTFSWQASRCNRGGVVYHVFAILEA